MDGSTRAPLHLLACEAGAPFARGVAQALGAPLDGLREVWFACGEGKAEITTNVRGGDVYIFQSIIAPQDPHTAYERLVMLLHACDAAAQADAQWITAVLPYYPGARQDKRKGRTREGISASLFARLLKAAGVRRVVSVEIHNDAIAGMFDPRFCLLDNVYLTGPLAGWLRARGLAGQVVAAPDVGGMERARRYAATLGGDLAALSKERDYSQPNTVLQSTLIGEVRGRDVLLVDDIVDTAGSVVAAVAELKAHGARDITVACAHPVLSPPAWERLGGVAERAAAEGWRFTAVGSSAVQHPGAPPWYQEFPIETLLAKVIRSINTRGSGTRAQEEGP